MKENVTLHRQSLNMVDMEDAMRHAVMCLNSSGAVAARITDRGIRIVEKYDVAVNTSMLEVSVRELRKNVEQFREDDNISLRYAKHPFRTVRNFILYGTAAVITAQQTLIAKDVALVNTVLGSMGGVPPALIGAVSMAILTVPALTGLLLFGGLNTLLKADTLRKHELIGVFIAQCILEEIRTDTQKVAFSRLDCEKFLGLYFDFMQRSSGSTRLWLLGRPKKADMWMGSTNAPMKKITPPLANKANKANKGTNKANKETKAQTRKTKRRRKTLPGNSP